MDCVAEEEGKGNAMGSGQERPGEDGRCGTLTLVLGIGLGQVVLPAAGVGRRRRRSEGRGRGVSRGEWSGEWTVEAGRSEGWECLFLCRGPPSVAFWFPVAAFLMSFLRYGPLGKL